jgi:hypothetical protein
MIEMVSPNGTLTRHRVAVGRGGSLILLDCQILNPRPSPNTTTTV